MHPLNLALFDALAAGFSPSPAMLRFASAIALSSSWACAAVLAWAAWRRIAQRPFVLAVLAAAGVASLISQEIAASVGVPRPFMVGLSPAHVPHGLRAGLPSTHASVMFTVAFMLLLRRPMRDVGLLILAAAMATGWARIYVGIHFPFDVAAGALLGAGIAAVLFAVRAAAPRLAPQPAAALARPLLRALADGRTGPCLVLVFAFAAAWVGSNTPGMIGPAMLQEDGPVENGTVLLYLAAVFCVLMVRVAPLSRLDRTAICILLLAFAAREADWHLAHFGTSLLEAPGSRMLAAAILVPIAIAAGWLAKRAWSASCAMRSWRQWRPEATTSLTFIAVIGTAVILDQLPAQPGWFAAGSSPVFQGYLMLSFEEILELALPVLALLAILQARLGTQRDSASAAIERRSSSLISGYRPGRDT
ncbi:phosphatase PAP2 family protein [Variovorax paradoxus]|nr:phosphatase PAP2 family protein [Variovorax paradoxus]